MDTAYLKIDQLLELLMTDDDKDSSLISYFVNIYFAPDVM